MSKVISILNRLSPSQPASDITPNNLLTFRIFNDTDNYTNPVSYGSALSDLDVEIVGNSVELSGYDTPLDAKNLKVASVDSNGSQSILSPAYAVNTYPINMVLGSNGAWSLRQLSSTIQAVVRVRRVTDDTEQDFLPSEITDGTLSLFCDGGDGRVTKLYDQSGGINHLQQSNVLYQALIALSGVVTLENGKPKLDFDGTNVWVMVAQERTITDGNYSIHAVGINDNGGTNGNMMTNHTGTSLVGRAQWVQHHKTSDPQEDSVMFFNNGATSVGRLIKPWTTIVQFSCSNYGDNSDYIFSRNNEPEETVITGEAVSVVDTPLRIGNTGSFLLSSQWQGGFQEAIIYPQKKSDAQKIALEGNINTYYNIY